MGAGALALVVIAVVGVAWIGGFNLSPASVSANAVAGAASLAALDAGGQQSCRALTGDSNFVLDGGRSYRVPASAALDDASVPGVTYTGAAVSGAVGKDSFKADTLSGDYVVMCSKAILVYSVNSSFITEAATGNVGTEDTANLGSLYGTTSNLKAYAASGLSVSAYTNHTGDHGYNVTQGAGEAKTFTVTYDVNVTANVGTANGKTYFSSGTKPGFTIIDQVINGDSEVDANNPFQHRFNGQACTPVTTVSKFARALSGRTYVYHCAGNVEKGASGVLQSTVLADATNNPAFVWNQYKIPDYGTAFDDGSVAYASEDTSGVAYGAAFIHKDAFGVE